MPTGDTRAANVDTGAEEAYLAQMRVGRDAEAAQRWAHACEHYMQALRTAPAKGIPYLYLANALATAGHDVQALVVMSLGCDVAPGLLNAWRSAKVTDAVRIRSRRLDGFYRTALANMQRDVLAGFERDTGMQVPRVRDAIWCQTHDQPFEYRHPRQRPWLLYLPDLEPRPWFDGLLPGAEALQAAFAAICSEALAALENPAHVHPYVPEDEHARGDFGGLRGSRDWSALHLYKLGRAADPEVLDQFPVTLDALLEADLVRLWGQPMEVFLSVLDGRTTIEPHYGVANTRLTAHLPLIVPPGCFLDVAGDRREPVPGVLMGFDDSFAHTAGNPSGGRRVHLIFEAWRPDLEEVEKRALVACLEAREAWNAQRKLPDLGELFG